MGAWSHITRNVAVQPVVVYPPGEAKVPGDSLGCQGWPEKQTGGACNRRVFLDSFWKRLRKSFTQPTLSRACEACPIRPALRPVHTCVCVPLPPALAWAVDLSSFVAHSNSDSPCRSVSSLFARIEQYFFTDSTSLGV